MEEKKESCFIWIREHKKELIIAGISVGAIMALSFGLKNRALPEEKIESLKSVVKKATEKSHDVETFDKAVTVVDEEAKKIITRVPHDVSMHPRWLPENKKPSQQALAYAEEIGFPLAEGQTLVKAYCTGGKVA